MNKIVGKLIDKVIERKMNRIDKLLNSTNKEDFNKGVKEIEKILGKSNETLKRLESL